MTRIPLVRITTAKFDETYGSKQGRFFAELGAFEREGHRLPPRNESIMKSEAALPKQDTDSNPVVGKAIRLRLLVAL